MKTISLRSLSRRAPELTEEVLVLHNRLILGTFRPIPPTEPFDVVGVLSGEIGDIEAAEDNRKEFEVDEPVRKEVQKEQVKPEPRGRLSKGLGDVPGVTGEAGPERVDRTMTDAWTRSKPAPKK